MVIAGNDFLADCASRAGAQAERIHLIPTCVKPADYPLREPSLEHDSAADRPPELVWIGSSSTLKGLEARGELWERLGREFPGLRLRVICDRFPRFQNVEVVEVPWSEATEAQEFFPATRMPARSSGEFDRSRSPACRWANRPCPLKLFRSSPTGSAETLRGKPR